MRSRGIARFARRSRPYAHVADDVVCDNTLLLQYFDRYVWLRVPNEPARRCDGRAMRLLKTAVVFGCLVGLGGCSDPATEMASPGDVGADGDSARSAVDAAADTGEADRSIVEDVANAPLDAGDSTMLPPFDPAMWETARCDATVKIDPVTMEPYYSPPRRLGMQPKMTRSQFESVRGGHGNGNGLFADPGLNPGDGFVYDLFSSGEQDVRLSFYPFTTRTDDD